MFCVVSSSEIQDVPCITVRFNLWAWYHVSVKVQVTPMSVSTWPWREQIVAESSWWMGNAEELVSVDELVSIKIDEGTSSRHNGKLHLCQFSCDSVRVVQTTLGDKTNDMALGDVDVDYYGVYWSVHCYAVMHEWDFDNLDVNEGIVEYGPLGPASKCCKVGGQCVVGECWSKRFGFVAEMDGVCKAMGRRIGGVFD